MDTNRLRNFRVLSELGNLREAAAHLGMTHPGLAKSIRTLEVELGVKLVTKDGRGIRITVAGKKLLLSMQHCLEAEERLLAAASGLNVRQDQVVRLGTFEVFSTYLSPLLSRAFGDTRP